MWTVITPAGALRMLILDLYCETHLIDTVIFRPILSAPPSQQSRLHLDDGGSSSYVNSAAALQAAEEADAALPEGLYEACLKTGRTPTAGEVKMIYCTKVRLARPASFVGLKLSS